MLAEIDIARISFVLKQAADEAGLFFEDS